MTGQDTDLAPLKDLLNQAHTIIDDRELYDIWERIPESDDPDFKGDSFNEYIRQIKNPGAYDEWSARLEDIFFENNLNFLRFKMNTISGDARKTSKWPAHTFMRKVHELDRMISDPTVLAAYRTTKKQPATWPKISYKDGEIRQGNRFHTFRDLEYVRLFDLLWENRRIESPSGELVESGEPLERELIHTYAGISGHQRFKDIATGIRKAMNSAHISMKLAYPDKVILIVRQSKK